MYIHITTLVYIQQARESGICFRAKLSVKSRDWYLLWEAWRNNTFLPRKPVVPSTVSVGFSMGSDIQVSLRQTVLVEKLARPGVLRARVQCDGFPLAHSSGGISNAISNLLLFCEHAGCDFQEEGRRRGITSICADYTLIVDLRAHLESTGELSRPNTARRTQSNPWITSQWRA